MKQEKLSKSDKALIVVYELEKKRKSNVKITVEDVAVALWKKYPSEFCMKGYPQYPNVDIPKYITKLLNNGFINGGSFDYRLTIKGEEYVRNLMSKDRKDIVGIQESAIPSRNIKSEINRILNSKIFHYYIDNNNPKFVESDVFDFIGTSSRSLISHNKKIFLAKYNVIIKDILPFCERHKEQDMNAKNIIELWKLLYENFKEIIEREIK